MIAASSELLVDLGHDACADGLTAFADREFQPFVHGDWRDQLNLYIDVVTGHNHFGALGKLHDPSNIGGPEVELWPVPVEEWCVPSTLFFG